MARTLGCLDLCARLEEVEPLLTDRTDSNVLQQVLTEHGLLTVDEWREKVGYSEII